MGRKRKRVGTLTFEQKKKIFIWSDDHPFMTQTELAEKAKKEFVLNKQPGQATISWLLKNAHRYKNTKDEDLQSRHTRKVVFPELDEALANWILCSQTRDIMDGNIVKAKGARMPDKMGVVGDDRVAFSNGWLQAFQRRHGFHSFKAHGESGSVSEQAIPALVEIISDEVKHYALANVYNFDETGLFF